MPFGRTITADVDATPLFVLLAGAASNWSGDPGFCKKQRGQCRGRGLQWIDRHGDRDGDGFVGI